MTNLTEKWKKGELPCGWYWCECYNEEIKILYYDGDCFELDDPETKNYYFFLKKDCAEITILEKVPSYEEWQETEKRSWLVPEFDNEIDELNDTIEELEKENAQLKKWCKEFNALEVAEENTKLKSLLKECKHIMSIEKDFASCHFEKDKLCKLLTKIYQVLGEE